MISKEKIARINELSAKAKSEEGLTEEEHAERKCLHKEYVCSIRSNLKSQLDNIKFVEDEGRKENDGVKKH